MQTQAIRIWSTFIFSLIKLIQISMNLYLNGACIKHTIFYLHYFFLGTVSMFVCVFNLIYMVGSSLQMSCMRCHILCSAVSTEKINYFTQVMFFSQTGILICLLIYGTLQLFSYGLKYIRQINTFRSAKIKIKIWTFKTQKLLGFFFCIKVLTQAVVSIVLYISAVTDHKPLARS